MPGQMAQLFKSGDPCSPRRMMPQAVISGLIARFVGFAQFTPKLIS
jgi:hypothetical protein